MANEKQRLILDLESLLPGSTLIIGDQTLDIRPLGVLKITIIVRKLKGLGTVLAEEGVTWDNYSKPENLVKLSYILLDNAPEVLSEASNIELDDLQELPIEIILQILDKVIEVNMKSKDALLGNWNSLAGKLNLLPPKKKSISRKRFKN